MLTRSFGRRPQKGTLPSFKKKNSTATTPKPSTHYTSLRKPNKDALIDLDDDDDGPPIAGSSKPKPKPKPQPQPDVRQAHSAQPARKPISSYAPSASTSIVQPQQAFSPEVVKPARPKPKLRKSGPPAPPPPPVPVVMSFPIKLTERPPQVAPSSDLSDLTASESEHVSTDDEDETPKKKSKMASQADDDFTPDDKQKSKEKSTSSPVKGKGKGKGNEKAPVLGPMAQISKLTGPKLSASSSASLGDGEGDGKRDPIRLMELIREQEQAMRDEEDLQKSASPSFSNITIWLFYPFSVLLVVQAEEKRGKSKRKTLCPYCSEPLPSIPSAKLVAILKSLFRASHPAPTASNPNARTLPMAKSINACSLHRSESLLLPMAKVKGWPLRIEWEHEIERVYSPPVVRQLERMINHKEESVFYEMAKNRVKELGKGMSRSARGQFEVFEKCQPG